MASQFDIEAEAEDVEGSSASHWGEGEPLAEEVEVVEPTASDALVAEMDADPRPQRPEDPFLSDRVSPVVKPWLHLDDVVDEVFSSELEDAEGPEDDIQPRDIEDALEEEHLQSVRRWREEEQ